MAVSQAFIFHFKCHSILHFAVCQLLCWTVLFLNLGYCLSPNCRHHGNATFCSLYIPFQQFQPSVYVVRLEVRELMCKQPHSVTLRPTRRRLLVHSHLAPHSVEPRPMYLGFSDLAPLSHFASSYHTSHHILHFASTGQVVTVEKSRIWNKVGNK